MSDIDGDDRLRRILLEYSDHRAVRNVFGVYTGRAERAADAVDFVEAMRATGGRVAVVGSEESADVYARWNATDSRYECVTIWPPWSVGERERADADELATYLEELDDVEPIVHDRTPFVDEGPSTDRRPR